jgi:hypothetical protein
MNVSAGNVIAFTSALGYRYVLLYVRQDVETHYTTRIKSDTVKDGYLFTKANLTIHMFRVPKVRLDLWTLFNDITAEKTETKRV